MCKKSIKKFNIISTKGDPWTRFSRTRSAEPFLGNILSKFLVLHVHFLSTSFRLLAFLLLLGKKFLIHENRLIACFFFRHGWVALCTVVQNKCDPCRRERVNVKRLKLYQKTKSRKPETVPKM